MRNHTELETQLYKACVALMVSISPDYKISDVEEYFKAPMKYALKAVKKYETGK